MGQAVKHIHTQHHKTLVVYDRHDPTRTGTLRNRYAGEMRKRFRWLRGIILDAVVGQDVFGLSGGQDGLQVNADSRLGKNAFAFPRTDQKVSAFMEWLQRMVDRGILEVRDRNRIGDSINQTWQNVFLEDTYKRGVIRANYELRQGGWPGVQSLDARGGINMVMGLPMHVDRLGVLYTRAFNDLKGITDVMDTQISRVLSQGLADGDGPRLIARKLNAAIKGGGADLGLVDTLGRFIPAERRAQILARTEIIRAHHQGMMQEYRNWGVQGVNVKAEVRPAGDDRVCAECEGLEGTVYTLDEAQNLIPVHPMCRCIVLPFREGVDTPSRVRAEDVESELGEWQKADTAEKVAEQYKEMNVQFGMHSGKVVENIAEEMAQMPESISRLNDVGTTLRNDIFRKFPKLQQQMKASDIKLELLMGAPGSMGIGVQGVQWANLIKLARKRFTTSKGKLKIGERFVDNSFTATVRHEFGHFVDVNLWTPEVRKRWNDLFEAHGGVRARFWKEGISEYGASSAAEAWAEVFTVITHPAYRPGMLPPEVEEFVKSIF